MGRSRKRRFAPPGWEEERKERLRQQRRQKALREASKRKPHPVTVIRVDGSTEILQAHAKRPEYHRYIQSPAWRARKIAYYRKHPKICVACGSTDNIHLHHHTYVRLTCELDDDLVPLCQLCHDGVHQREKLSRESLTIVTFKFIESRLAQPIGRL